MIGSWPSLVNVYRSRRFHASRRDDYKRRLSGAICRRWRTVPCDKTGDGIHIPSQIARSLPFDLSRLAARGVSIRSRKQRSASIRQLAIRVGFGSQASSYRSAKRAMEYASIWFALRKLRASSASAFRILRAEPMSACGRSKVRAES